MRRDERIAERDWVDTIRTRVRIPEKREDEAVSYFDFPNNRHVIGWAIERRSRFTYYVVAPMFHNAPLLVGPFWTRWTAESARKKLPRYL